MSDFEEEGHCVEPEVEGDEDLVIASRDFDKVAASRNKSGFVEGVMAGKDKGLREGFSAGFISGLAVSTPWAILKGQAEALGAYYTYQGEIMEERLRHHSRLQDMAADVETAEGAWRRTQIDKDRQSYQEEVAKEATGATAMDTGGVKGDASGSSIVVATDTRGVSRRSGCDVTYGNFVGNVDTPAIVEAFRTILEPCGGPLLNQ